MAKDGPQNGLAHRMVHWMAWCGVDGLQVRGASSVCGQHRSHSPTASIGLGRVALSGLIRLISCHKSVKPVCHVIKICQGCQDLQLCFLYPITSSVRASKNIEAPSDLLPGIYPQCHVPRSSAGQMGGPHQANS